MFDCKYELRATWKIGSIYTCSARIVYLGDTHEVIDVSYDHLPGYTNADVKGVYITGQPITIVPRNISNFFPNLESLDLRNVDVTEVTNRDLLGLNKLKEFILVKAKIQILESDLFVNNNLLQSISFNSNSLRHVAHHVFDNLPYLTSLDLLSSGCINSVSSSRAVTEALIFNLIINCPASFQMTENKILNGDGLQSQIDDRVSFKTDHLLNMLLESEKRVEELEVRVEALEQIG